MSSELVPIEVHRDRVLAASHRLPAETVPLVDALGRVLADDVTARFELPPWDNSGMDGYAVRFADIGSPSPEHPTVLDVVADLPAGTDLDPALLPGQAARIMTGAPVPSDADTVIPLELTDQGTERVSIDGARPFGAHVRRRAEDRAVGDLIARGGTCLSSRAVSAIASAGHASVDVVRRPRVAVIATGSELVAPGEPIGRGQIPDSNSLLVAGLVAETGALVVSAERVADDVEALAAAVARAETVADVVVLTGGVSVGAYDPVKALFAGSSTVAFAKVSMQPGKPQAFGTLPSGALVFGLPGNPVSVWISFDVFVRPALLTLLGRLDVLRPVVSAVAAEGWRTPGGRTQYLPGLISDDGSGRTIAPASKRGSGSHLVGSLAGANGYAIVDPSIAEVLAGDTVSVVEVEQR